jgi:hypothetical protein
MSEKNTKMCKQLCSIDLGVWKSCGYTRVYPKFSGLAAWSENCKWYRSLPLGAVVSLFCVSLVSFVNITLCVASQRVFVVVVVVFVIDSVRKLLDTPS